jgi:hypothetical protein
LIEKLKEKYSRNGWVSIVAAVTDKRPRNRGPIPKKSNRIFLYFMASSCFSGPQRLLPVTPGTTELFLRCTVQVTGDWCWPLVSISCEITNAPNYTSIPRILHKYLHFYLCKGFSLHELTNYNKRKHEIFRVMDWQFRWWRINQLSAHDRDHTAIPTRKMKMYNHLQDLINCSLVTTTCGDRSRAI